MKSLIALPFVLASCFLSHVEDPMASNDKRETIIAPLGYMTTPNQYGVFPEGALSQAENVVLRNKGKLLTAPDAALSFLSTGWLDTDACYAMMPLDAGHVYSFSATGSAWNSMENNVLVGFPSGISATDLFPYKRTSPVRSRDRMLVNSNQGVLVSDSMAPVSTTDRDLRLAGLPQPTVNGFSFTAVTNGPIPNNIMVGYSAVLTREFDDGYIVKSVPSVIEKFLNNSGSALQTTFHVQFHDAEEGDFIEVYRTDGLSTTSVDADPGNTLKMIIRYSLNALDVINGTTTLTDTTVLTAPFYSTTGKELYTNQYQEGETGANRQPDINGAQAVFKGFTFIGNITERPQTTLQVPAGFATSGGAPTTYNRSNGIGTRTGAGTFTSGSPTITGVSAADIAGVRVGQRWTLGTGFGLGTSRVTAVGTSTITMSTNATASGTLWALADVMEVSTPSGPVVFLIDGAGGFLDGLTTASAGAYEITTSESVPRNTSTWPQTSTITFDFEPARPNVSSFTLRATGGQFYVPPLPDIAATAATFSQKKQPNMLRWSKDSEPEHFPSTNETLVGSGQIIQLVPTKEALWIFCTDGIYRLSGDAGQWQILAIAPGCVLCSPGCATSMRDSVYAYTNYGFVAVTDAGVVPISDLQIKAQLPGPPYLEGATPNAFVVNNDDDEEVLIFIGFPSSMFYVYNARQNGFTYVKNGPVGRLNAMTAAAYQQNPASGSSAVIIANNSPNPGTSPGWVSWNASNLFLSPKVQYRNLYAKNPMNVKQWIDCTYIFELPPATFQVTGTISGVVAGVATTVIAANDAYATIGVPRNYAISPSLQPGFTLPVLGNQRVFEGVSCRHVDLGVQQVHR